MNDTFHENDAAKGTLDLPRAWVTYLTAAVEILFAIIAILGNIVSIGAVALKKKLRTLANAFMVNLSLTDIVAAVMVSALSVDAYIRRAWKFGHTLCVLHNLLHPALMSISLLLSSCIAINRYIYIAHQNVYHRITNKITVSFALLFSWSFPLALYVMTVPKHSQYSPPTFRCRAYVSELEFAFTVYIPSLVTLTFYTLIFFAVRKSRQRVQVYPGQNGGPNAQEVRMLKVLLAVFFLVSLGYLPSAVLVNTYISLGKPPPAEIFVILYPCLHVAGVINPILYGACNRNFRIAYNELLTGKLFRRKVTSSGESDRSAAQNTSTTGLHGNRPATTTLSLAVSQAGPIQKTSSLTPTTLEDTTEAMPPPM
ncbi:melatonin receptor type 1A-like [Ptychodera flava]|uniref:melatonin receptor type 1A-like n=1 Tax=Ptychodera flava TaxID=63121 RepID=UPI00396A59D8